MLITCPGCRQSLNITNTVGTFVCPYCRSQCQIAPTPSHASPMAYPGYAGGYNQPPASPYTPGMTPSQYALPQPIIQPNIYQSADPIENAFRMASGGIDSLTVAGLRTALERLNIRLTDAICNQLFMKHDLDRSGSIQIHEFREIYKEVNQWINIFNQLDTDHSGKMEYGEFVDAMKKLNFNIAEASLPNIFQHIDSLHNNYIDLNGFIKIVSIIQVIQLKMRQFDPQCRGTITVDMNGILDIVMALPL